MIARIGELSLARTGIRDTMFRLIFGRNLLGKKGLRVVPADGILQGMEILPRDSGATTRAPIAGLHTRDQLRFGLVPS